MYDEIFGLNPLKNGKVFRQAESLQSRLAKRLNPLKNGKVFRHSYSSKGKLLASVSIP